MFIHLYVYYIRSRFLHFIGASPGLFVPAWEDNLSIKNDEKSVDCDGDADTCQAEY
jgi:hypothetical protein